MQKMHVDGRFYFLMSAFSCLKTTKKSEKVVWYDEFRYLCKSKSSCARVPILYY